MAEAPREGRIRPMTPEELRQAEAAAQAEILAEVEARDVANEHEGGRYLVNGQMVDAEGDPVKTKKD